MDAGQADGDKTYENEAGCGSATDAQFTAARDGVRYIFCGHGCRDEFVAGGAGRVGRYQVSPVPARSPEHTQRRRPSQGKP
jgi:hypothetical protein